MDLQIRLKQTRRWGDCHMFPMTGSTQSVITVSQSTGNMRLWAVLLLALLSETFAGDGEYLIARKVND